MSAGTVIHKGQITLPREIQEHLHLVDGDRVEFLIKSNGKVELQPVSRSIKSLFGRFHRPGMPPLSVEEIDEAIGRYLAEEDERIRRGEMPRNEE
ncbi:MAG TPA: AbrB/MazE/SpoVT family DNA-binding domain-containing protein [Thermoanaerobaculia bacterium]|nr:AbrB/MazE/SpoVT family DNA-binding domain-containing protein [Thermoanaerobaculia bacterium]